MSLLRRILNDDDDDEPEDDASEETQIALPWVPPPFIQLYMRADFRVQYFMNDASHRYNFELAQYMFARRLEYVFVHHGTVRVRTLDGNARFEDDDRENDDEARAAAFDFPLYATHPGKYNARNKIRVERRAPPVKRTLQGANVHHPRRG